MRPQIGLHCLGGRCAAIEGRLRGGGRVRRLGMQVNASIFAAGNDEHFRWMHARRIHGSELRCTQMEAAVSLWLVKQQGSGSFILKLGRDHRRLAAQDSNSFHFSSLQPSAFSTASLASVTDLIKEHRRMCKQSPLSLVKNIGGRK